jgi:hypothetical protein
LPPAGLERGGGKAELLQTVNAVTDCNKEDIPPWSHERDLEPKIAAVIKALNRCSLAARK